MDTPLLHEEREWPFVLTLLPPDLEDTARQSQALMRCRNVPDAAALMRMALAYAVSDLSLKDVAAWANALGVAQITGPGLFYRLREAEAWLAQVLAQTLQSQVHGEDGCRMPLRVVDATVITGPGATGTEWRAHVLIDPRRGGFRSVELTDATGGEGYGRHPVQPGEVILGDRAYATARGLWAAQSAQGKKGSEGWGQRVYHSGSNSPRKTQQEPQNLGPVAGPGLGSGSPCGRPDPSRRGDLDSYHALFRTSLGAGVVAVVSPALADRIVFQAAEIAVAFGHAPFAARTHGKIVDAGAFLGGGLSSEVGTAFRSAFPLGIRLAARRATLIVLGQGSA